MGKFGLSATQVLTLKNFLEFLEGTSLPPVRRVVDFLHVLSMSRSQELTLNSNCLGLRTSCFYSSDQSKDGGYSHR